MGTTLKLDNRRVFFAILSIVAAAVAGPSWAYDHIVSGFVSQFEVSSDGVAEFRVHLNRSTDAFCGTSTSPWGYLNHTDANYQAYVSELTVAYATRDSTQLYLTKDSSNLCHIDFISVSH